MPNQVWRGLLSTAAVLTLLAGASPANAQRLLLREFLPAELPPLPPPVAVVNDAAAQRLFESEFLAGQLRHERVLRAQLETRFRMKELFAERGIEYPAAEMFIRVFKREYELELWVRPHGSDRFALLKTYEICALAGEPGPKRRRGDNQVPEGFYQIDRFNPNSAYFLSLYINYPNQSDRALGGQASLGGDIFIHGGCRTIGCIAVTDDGIKEIYWLAVEARASGQRNIPVHIFPFKLTDTNVAAAQGIFADRPELLRFWRSLETGFRHFEESRTVPRIAVDGAGFYVLDDGSGRDVPPGRRILGEPVAVENAQGAGTF